MNKTKVVWVILILVFLVAAYMLGGAYTHKSASAFALSSSAFANGGSIPSEYTCDGASTNPPLAFVNPPAGTQSYALTMWDPDVPTKVLAQGYFNHWEAFNIPGTAMGLDASSSVGTPGMNGSNQLGYTGPCPPPQYAPAEHRYIFTVYALDSMLSLPQGATRQQIEAAVAGHVLGFAQLVGKYKKVSAQ